MNDRRLPALIKTVEGRHRRIERKEGIERQRGRLALQRQGFVAAQFRPIGIANRWHRGEPIERAAQHNDQKPRIAPLGHGRFWQIGPGE